MQTIKTAVSKFVRFLVRVAEETFSSSMYAAPTGDVYQKVPFETVVYRAAQMLFAVVAALANQYLASFGFQPGGFFNFIIQETMNPRSQESQ